jgi:hypothetical protein
MRSEEEARLAEARGELALRKLVKGVMAHGNERRWKMVESVALFSQSPSSSWAVPLLENVAPYIRSLDIFQEQGVHRDADSIDSQLLACHRELLLCGTALSFGSLTTVRLFDGALYHLQFIPFLCDSAPNLLMLEFEYQAHYQVAARIPESSPGCPRTILRDTKLRHLALQARCAGSIGVTRNYDPGEMIRNLIDRSPLLSDLSCEVYDALRKVPLVEGVRRLPHLTNLYWDCRGRSTIVPDGEDAPAGDGPPFRKLKRVVVRLCGWSFPVSLGAFIRVPS